MGFAETKLVLGLLFASIGLLGCEQASTADSPTEVPLTSPTVADEISLRRAKLITPGMSRHEVLAILGPVHNYTGKLPERPICDSFRNEAAGEESFVQVLYRDQLVRAAYGGLSVPCLIL